MTKILKSILEDGAYYTVSGFNEQHALVQKTKELILDAVEKILGISAKKQVSAEGIEKLHKVLPAEQIGQLRDMVVPSLREDLFRFTCEFGEHFLGIEHEFFIDDYTILRVNYPYDVALKSSQKAENPGIGRVDAQTREMRNSTQQKDERYDPKSYHRHTPPASWAHGPHKDTWTGHSRKGINLWWAVGDVFEENSMIFFPGTFKISYEPDPRSLYLSEGFQVPKPNKMALHSGELLVFNPELLHATHLNTSQYTRLALSTRINAAQPKFDPSCFYAREFWHSSQDIKNGNYSNIRQFKREENLEIVLPLEDEIKAEKRIRSPLQAKDNGGGWLYIEISKMDVSIDRHHVILPNGDGVALFYREGEWKAVQLTCPHLDTNLLDGYCSDTQIYCPAHGVAYSLSDGRSSSQILKLKVYEIENDGTYIRIRNKNNL